jgi:hypothetical protein
MESCKGKKCDKVGDRSAAVCCQGLKDRLRDPDPDTPISFLPNNAFFVAHLCALLERNEINR